ncbi:protein TIFY 10A-like [Pistacia vera]|uniref:Uncharacterized protein n=1 Tax=Pistacia integerrima TaxID=434235 RepID=A0ACC0Y8X8_9ROSI|nr:protein TIFY 10A-like [Pistacia vera]KAJ0030852.1 hypothetical protein Pint_13537 [Pistacia integerrima]
MANSSEKSSFSQTCSLLSQYLKERGGFGDLSLGMSCTIEANGTSEAPRRPAATTMNLFPIFEKSGDVLPQNAAAAPRNLESMNFFPQLTGFAAKKDVPVDSSFNKSVAAEPQTAQMTIFYGGQVIVFNDFPADRANEIMLLAGQGSSQGHSTTTLNPLASSLSAKTPIESTSPVTTTSLVKNPTEPSCSVPSSSNLMTEHVQPKPRPVTCDLPIARRNSLHRFLEKRKDRITARAPYQPVNPEALPNKAAESKSWLGLAAQSPQ